MSPAIDILCPRNATGPEHRWREPYKDFVVGDGRSYPYFRGWPGQWACAAPGTLHAGGSDGLFLDWHVKWYQAQLIEEDKGAMNILWK